MVSKERSLAILACRQRTAAPVREMAARFVRPPASVATLCRRAEKLVESDDAARDLWRKVVDRLVE